MQLRIKLSATAPSQKTWMIHWQAAPKQAYTLPVHSQILYEQTDMDMEFRHGNYCVMVLGDICMHGHKRIVLLILGMRSGQGYGIIL